MRTAQNPKVSPRSPLVGRAPILSSHAGWPGTVPLTKLKHVHSKNEKVGPGGNVDAVEGISAVELPWQEKTLDD